MNRRPLLLISAIFFELFAVAAIIFFAFSPSQSNATFCIRGSCFPSLQFDEFYIDLIHDSPQYYCSPAAGCNSYCWGDVSSRSCRNAWIIGNPPQSRGGGFCAGGDCLSESPPKINYIDVTKTNEDENGATYTLKVSIQGKIQLFEYGTIDYYDEVTRAPHYSSHPCGYTNFTSSYSYDPGTVTDQWWSIYGIYIPRQHIIPGGMIMSQQGKSCTIKIITAEGRTLFKNIWIAEPERRIIQFSINRLDAGLIQSEGRQVVAASWDVTGATKITLECASSWGRMCTPQEVGASVSAANPASIPNASPDDTVVTLRAYNQYTNKEVVESRKVTRSANDKILQSCTEGLGEGIGNTFSVNSALGLVTGNKSAWDNGWGCILPRLGESLVSPVSGVIGIVGCVAGNALRGCISKAGASMLQSLDIRSDFIDVSFRVEGLILQAGRAVVNFIGDTVRSIIQFAANTFHFAVPDFVTNFLNNDLPNIIRGVLSITIPWDKIADIVGILINKAISLFTPSAPPQPEGLPLSAPPCAVTNECSQPPDRVPTADNSAGILRVHDGVYVPNQPGAARDNAIDANAMIASFDQQSLRMPNSRQFLGVEGGKDIVQSQLANLTADQAQQLSNKGVSNGSLLSAITNLFNKSASGDETASRTLFGIFGSNLQPATDSTGTVYNYNPNAIQAICAIPGLLCRQ